jgi:tetratricopeptide (TPR) repeat protein
MMPELLAASTGLRAQGIIPSVLQTARVAQYGRMLAEVGRLDEARQQLAAVAPAMPTEKLTARQAAALLHWGCGVLALGDRRQMREVIELTEKALARYGRAATWNYDAAAAHRLLAELHLAFGENALAVEHAQKALGVLGLRQYSIERYHLTLACAFRAAGRPVEAADAIRAAYQRVLLVAGRTPDPDVQGAWLEHVAENREIIAWWEAINQPDALPAATAN